MNDFLFMFLGKSLGSLCRLVQICRLGIDYVIKRNQCRDADEIVKIQLYWGIPGISALSDKDSPLLVAGIYTITK